jgi:hypothetical protein
MDLAQQITAAFEDRMPLALGPQKNVRLGSRVCEKEPRLQETDAPREQRLPMGLDVEECLPIAGSNLLGIIVKGNLVADEEKRLGQGVAGLTACSGVLHSTPSLAARP